MQLQQWGKAGWFGDLFVPLGQSEEKTEPYKFAKMCGVTNMHIRLIIPSTVARKDCSNITGVPSKKLSKPLIFSQVQCQSQNWHCLPVRSVPTSSYGQSFWTIIQAPGIPVPRGLLLGRRGAYSPALVSGMCWMHDILGVLQDFRTH